MSLLLQKYLPRTEFTSYQDFIQNYRLNIPANFNFGFDCVDAWAEAEPKKRALVWCNDHGGEKTFTFAEISRLSNQTVHFLKDHGVRKGDAVLVVLRRRWEYWVVATALCKLGATIIPATLQLTAKDIKYRVERADIKMMFCVNDPFVLEQANLSGITIPKVVVGVCAALDPQGRLTPTASDQTKTAEAGCLGASEAGSHLPDRGARCAGDCTSSAHDGFIPFDISAYPAAFPRPVGDDAAKNEDAMLIYFTSGTTGMPKMVRHNFLHPLGHIVTAKYWQQVQENTLHMSVSDSGWAKFGWGKIYGQWLCGAAIFAYDMDKFIPKNLLQKMQDYKLTTFCAPPTMYRFMLDEMEGYDLSSIQNFCNAGEPLNPDLFIRLREITGKMLREGFGQSESSVLIANFPWDEPRPGSTGKPAPLYDIDLINAAGESCADGEEGEIVIRGLGNPSGLFTEYYKDPEVNAVSFRNGCYCTGDLAWRDDDGYYWFVGRNDDVIKCSGYRIGPFEVESALSEHAAVQECAVTAAPDPVRGQVVKATVVLAAGFEPSDELVKTLQTHVKTVTAPYKYPRIIEFVAELPKTFSGKIKRAEIRKGDHE